MEHLKSNVSDEIIAIDGKTLRKSFDKANSKSAIHMVSAWSAKNGCVLGQVKVSEKSNEIKAVPKLLDLLDIADCVVTMDAMGCQKTHAKKIISKKSDYLLALKGNQKGLYQEVKEFFLDAQKFSFDGVEHQYFSDIDKSHGRIESRKYYLFTKLDYFSQTDQWKGIKGVGVATYKTNKSKNIGIRYYITSLDKIETFAKSVRRHWSIENELHWVLDVAFNEDKCRVRDGNASENFAVVRHIALNLLKKENTKKIGIKSKRLKAGWDNDYLVSLLFQ
jgi:predicted transposase YbfD/YdcC